MSHRLGLIARSICNIQLNISIVLVIAYACLLIGGSILGVGLYSVRTGSMEPTLPIGTLVFVDKGVSGEDVKPNDILAFDIGKTNGEICTHRVVSNSPDTRSLVTKGDANDCADGSPVAYESIEGLVMLGIPYLGSALELVGRWKHILFTCLVLQVLLASLACSVLPPKRHIGKRNTKENHGTAIHREQYANKV